MHSWIHSLSRSLTLRDLAVRFVDLPCEHHDRLSEVLKRAKTQLADQSTASRTPMPTRACVRLKGSGEDHVLLLDSCLASESWAQFCTEDDSRVSLYARRVEICQLIDGAATFREGMSRLQEIVEQRLKEPAGDDSLEQNLFPRDFLVVLHQGRWHGIITSLHFTAAVPVRAAIWAMLLEIEQAVVDRAFREPEGVLEALSRNRLESAFRRATDKQAFLFGWNSVDELWAAEPEQRLGRAAWIVSATMFIDKLTIAVKREWCLSELSKKKADSLCGKLDQLRNWCCHSNIDEADYTMSELIELTGAAQEILMQILRWDA